MEIIAAHVELEGNALEAEGSVVEYTTLTLNEGDNLSIVLTKKGTSASHVWDYFGFLCNTSNDTVLDPTNVYCEICFRSKEVRRYGAKTSTGNLGSHLSKKHGIISTKSKGIELSFLKPKKLLLSSSEQKASRSVRTSIKKASQVNRLSREIVTWLARDLLPLETVEGQGFADFGRQRGIIYGDDKPSFSLLARGSLNEVFDWAVEIIRTELGNAPKTLAVTFDSWVDHLRQLSYVSYTVHWIDSQWKVKKIPLTTSFFPYPSTASAVADDFKEVLMEFGLTERSFVSTTNGGSCTKEACDLLGMQHHMCVGHGLHSLLTRDLMEQLGSNHLSLALEKMTNIHKAIICKFVDLQKHTADSKNEALRDLLDYHAQLDDILQSEDRVDIASEEDSLSIATTEITSANGQAQIIQFKNKSCTRWHVLLAMIKNYLSFQAPIKIVLESLESQELMFTDEEMEVLNVFVDILEIFKSTSEMLCGEEYATLNLSVLFRSAIIKRIEEDIGDLELQVKARVILLENVDKWFPLNDVNVCAALLDPSMRKLIAIEEYLTAKGITNAQLLQSMVSAYGATEETLECPMELELPLDDSQPAWKRLKTDYLKECTTTGPCNTLESEIAKYFMVSSTDEEPLTWWKKNEHLFPQLSLVAKIFHSIPAISAPSQRIFSTTGVLGTAKRSTLNPTIVKQVLFIHDNYDLASELDKTRSKVKNADISTGML